MRDTVTGVLKVPKRVMGLMHLHAVGRGHLGPHHSCMSHMQACTHPPTCTLQHHNSAQVGAKEFSAYIILLYKQYLGMSSFSGTGQTEVGWSVSAAGSPCHKVHHNEIALSHDCVFPSSQWVRRKEAIHGGELGQCCGCVGLHMTNRREQVSPSG